MSEQSAAPARRSGACPWFPWLLFVPTLLYLLAMTVTPLIGSLVASFTNYSLGQSPRWVGVTNYRQFLADPGFWAAARNTAVLTVSAVSLEVVLGVCLAMLFSRPFPGSGFLRTVLFVPMMLSPLVVGYFWRFMLDGSVGVIPQMLRPVAPGATTWLTQPGTALACIVAVDVWQWTPLVFLLTLAGLGAIPRELYEVAALQRASAWLQFTRITLPYLRFPLLLALLFRTIDTVKMFDLVYILTGGGPGDSTLNLSMLTYKTGFYFSEVGPAAALSWLIVALINVLAVLLIGRLSQQTAGRHARA